MVRIFAMNVTGQDFYGARWRPYLSAERKEAAGKRRQERERQLYLGAEALLNLSLEKIGVQIPLPALYERNEHGKPYLTADCGVYVNWSHSGEYVLMAVADKEVGVDIQISSVFPRETLVRRVLQPQERRYYEETAAEERQQLFYRYWAVKESFLKALGTGFSQDLKSFWVDMKDRGNHPQIVQNIDARAWDCRILETDFIGQDYAAAVCCEGDADTFVENICGWQK